MRAAINTKPPTKKNITEIARDIREYWGSRHQHYCPNVCYQVVDGRMRLVMTYNVPDEGSDTKLLFYHDDPRLGIGRVADYRADVCRELRLAGVRI